jgi:hypothetical protein
VGARRKQRQSMGVLTRRAGFPPRPAALAIA